MTEPLRISPAPPERVSQSYGALRAAGVDLIQQLAGETWTDHNVHDPGITVLEAFCYAMTELGLRIQLDVADLLRSGESRRPAALVPAHRVLTTGPVTVEDLRRLLLDHPRVADALVATDAESEVAFHAGPPPGPPLTYEAVGPRVRPRGLGEVLVAFAVDDPELDLNSNTYAVTMEVAGRTHAVEIALPHWDEEEAAPFRRGATVAGVAMLAPGGSAWRPLPEALTFFGEVEVQTGGGETVELWAVLRLTEPVAPADVAGILAAAEVAVEATGEGTLIDRFVERVLAADGAARRIESYVAGWRNLCEETVRLSVVREQEIAVGARIEVTGGADLERLLADVLLAIDRELSPPLRFHSLEELLGRGLPVEELFDGPLLSHGFLTDEDLPGHPARRVVYVSDVLRLVMRRRLTGGGDVVGQENPGGRDIVAVTDLRLSNYVNNRPITTDARDCLRLVETERYRPRLSLAKSRITFVRDDVEVSYDRSRVERLFQEGREADRRVARAGDPSPTLPVPRGEVLPVGDYFPFQNDLPRIYGVGEAGLPAGAGVERRARALQTQGYLLLFEQLLSDLVAQLENVNRFFSPDAGETATYFTRPLFDLPDVERLLTRFAAGADREAFLADPENPHVVGLRDAVEDRDRFLDRRNRMLDHLLARLGEETVAWGQELHRWAQSELRPAAVPPEELPTARAERRRAVNARLVRAKAAFLADAPELSAHRMQAFGALPERRPDVLVLDRDETGHGWSLVAGGEVRLRSPGRFGSRASAAADGAYAAALASQEDFYRNVHVGGGFRRYRLGDGGGSGNRVVGESPTTFETIAAAQAALEESAAAFAELRLAESLTPMERRVAHLTGIRSSRRRRLVVSPDAFFELTDATTGDGVIDAWRLFREPGPAGAVLLVSTGAFTAATDPEAEELARRSIQEVVRWGLDDWSYQVAETAPESFEIRLESPTGEVLARGATAFPSREAAEQAVVEVTGHLDRSYGAEGFHLVEHLLLRPRQGPSGGDDGDPFLTLPASEAEGEQDPYSHRLSLIFPSGHARDFGDAASPRTGAPPHRFRDPELRRHVERTVRQACPAHLLPVVHWVDRDLSTPPHPGSFEELEERYFAWLGTVLVPGGDPTAIRAARNGLVLSLNALVDGEGP